MKYLYTLLFVVASVAIVYATDDDEDHSKHCHIQGYPSIHLNFGEYIDLPGACLRLYCRTTDLFEAVDICKSVPNSSENVEFAKKLLAGEICPI